MKTKKGAKIIWTIVIIIIVTTIFFLVRSPKEINPELDSFAQCLTDKGLKMYGTEWCSHCKNQKEFFGDSFKSIDYTDCDINKETCLIEGITGYPTWKINGESYPGEQSLETLAKLAGCEL